MLLLCCGCGKPAPPTLNAEFGNIRITGGFAYSPITQESGAAYFTIRNTSDKPDTLVSAQSPIAKSAMIHGTMQSGRRRRDGEDRAASHPLPVKR